MFKIEKKVFNGELTYDNTVILKYYIEYPQICSNYINEGIRNFNIYNYDKAIKLKQKSKTDLYNDAIEIYKYNKENGYPIMVFEVYSEFEITYNRDEIISLYIDDYFFTGGAHGNTIRSSQNWDMKNGKQFKLKDFYPYNSEYILDILREIVKQIEENIKNGNNIYFDDYCCLLIQTFNENNFYLEDNYIVIYFQQYDIGPYVSGIITFKIKR